MKILNENDYDNKYGFVPFKSSSKKPTSPVSNKVKKTVGGTATYLGAKTGTGGISVVEGIGNFGAGVLKNIGKATSWAVDNKVGKVLFGKDAGNYENNPFYQIGESITPTKNKYIDTKGKTYEKQGITDTLNKTVDDKLEKKSYFDRNSLATNVASGVGQVTGNILLGKVIGSPINPPINNSGKGVLNFVAQQISQPTTSTMFLSNAGNSYKKALDEGAGELEAATYGLLSGLKETGTEAMYGGLGKAFGKGALDDVIGQQISGMFKSKILQQTTKLGIGMTAEGLEEVASSLLEPFTSSVYKKKLDFSEYDNLVNEFVTGALTSGVLQSANGAVDIASNKIQNISNESTINSQNKTINSQKALPFSGNTPLSVSTNKITNLVNSLGRKVTTQNIKSEYMGKFKSTDIINSDTGLQLKLNAQGIKSTLAHSNNNSKLATVEFLDNFLTNAKLLNSETDTKGRPIEWTYLKDNVIIDGNPQTVILDVKKDVNGDGYYFYNHAIKNELTTNGIPTPDFVNSSDNNIAQNNTIVNNSNMQQVEKNTPIITTNRQNNMVVPTGEIETSKVQKNLSTSPIVAQEYQNQVQEMDLDYQAITNNSTMEQAKQKLDSNLNNEVVRLFNLDPKSATALDVAELLQLQYQYQQNGDMESFRQSVDKLRQIGTNAGQSIQAFAILQRMTPEGMVYYAQKDLQNIFDEISRNKNQKWINENQEKYNLTNKETEFITNNMVKVQELNAERSIQNYAEQQQTERQQKILIAEIQKLINDKIPTTIGNELKSFRRISMLLNPKTQIRNIVSNVLINPLNRIGDRIGSSIDKSISKKTGIRTTAPTNYKAFSEGFNRGLSESIQDYKLGIDTSNIEGNKFDIGRSNSFNENTGIGKTLNAIDKFNSFLLRTGDQPFFEAEFNNSLQNQMKLNNVTEPSLDMIMTARDVALERTWQDNSKYSEMVIGIRNKLNMGKNFGLGDIIIPFAKTPANLTKAMVEYSPIGLVKSLTGDLKQLNNSISKGENTAQLQRKVINNMSKGVTGTMTYLLAYLMKNLIKGEKDKDKDLSNFEKDILGIQPYSFQIGNKTFTYDWAMPLSTPFAVIANTKDTEGTALSKAFDALGTMGDRLIDQSFLQGISGLFNSLQYNGFTGVVENFISDLPSSFVPTFLKQINDLIDPQQRIQYEKGEPIKTAINKAIAKIPIASMSLATKKDNLGNDVLKYGGANNIFNVFLNPANVNVSKDNKAAQEIKRLYETTGEKDFIPKVVGTSIKIGNETVILTAKQQSKFQEVSGKSVEKNLNKMINQKDYKNLTDEQKVESIKGLVDYYFAVAKKEVLGADIAKTYQSAYNYSKIGDVGDFFSFKTSVDDTNKDTKKSTVKKYLLNASLNDEQKAFMYSKYYSSDKALKTVLDSGIPMDEFIKYNSQGFESDYNANGAITNSKKKSIISYVNSLNLNIAQKAILIKMNYSTFKNYDKQIVEYVNNQKMTVSEKKQLLKRIGLKNYDKDIMKEINSMNISIDEKKKKLKELGFTVYESNGKVYVK